MINELRSELNAYYTGLVALLPKLILAIAILLFFILIGSLISRFVRGRIAPGMRDPLMARFIGGTIKLFVTIIGIIWATAILELEALAASILAGAGVTAIIVGFAFKDIGENFLAGILLAFSRPFKIGDTIETTGLIGNIVSLSLRNIQIKTPDGKDVFIPNGSIIKNPLINYTIDGFLRHEFIIGIDYKDDVVRASSIISKELSKVEGIIKERQVNILIHEFAPSTVNLKILYWVNTYDKKTNKAVLRSLIMNRVKNVLLTEGFNLPADIVELKIHDDKDPLPINILN